MTKKSFSSILNEPAPAPAASPVPPTPSRSAGGRPVNTPKGQKAISFHVDDDLVKYLDRLVFWRGKGSSMREVLNDALRAYQLTQPDAQRPMPGE